MGTIHGTAYLFSHEFFFFFTNIYKNCILNLRILGCSKFGLLGLCKIQAQGPNLGNTGSTTVRVLLPPPASQGAFIHSVGIIINLKECDIVQDRKWQWAS